MLGFWAELTFYELSSSFYASNFRRDMSYIRSAIARRSNRLYMLTSFVRGLVMDKKVYSIKIHC